MSGPLDDMEAFRAWLREQPTLRMFLRSDASSCPLACYLNDTQPGTWSVMPDIYENDDGFIRNPGWAVRFIQLFDAGAKNKRRDATEALMILQQVTP